MLERRRIVQRMSLRTRSIPTTKVTVLHPRIPVLCRSNRCGFLWFDQRNLLRPGPAFQLLFPRHGLVHLVERCPIQKPFHIVTVGETLSFDGILCSNTLLCKLPVKPMYRVPVRLPIMYTE